MGNSKNICQQFMYNTANNFYLQDLTYDVFKDL